MALLTMVDPAQVKGGTGWPLVSTRYAFDAQTPGGSLIVGSNTITLTPVPPGISGTNTLHYLRISGGTGTAEQVLITGGTAVSGAATGTVIFTCANTHSGAWTVQPASAGIQEAIWAAGITGSVLMPSGSHTTYATISIPHTYTKFSLHGAGAYSTTILPQSTSTDVLYWNTAGFVGLYDFGITGNHGGSGGWGVKVLDATFGEISGLYFDHGYNGMYLRNPNSIHVTHCVGYGIDRIGIQIDATDGGVAVSKFDSLDFSTYGHLAQTSTDTAGLYLTTQVGGTIAGPTFTDCQFLGFANAVLAEAAAGSNINEVTFVGGGITGHVYGLRVTSAGATAYNWRLDGMQYVASLSTDALLNGPAISIDEGVRRFSVSGCTIENASPTFQCIDIQGSKLVNIIGNLISNLQLAPEIMIRQGGSTNASDVRILDNEIGYNGAAFTALGSYAITTSAHAHANIIIQNNRMYGTTAALNFLATGLGSYITGNNIDPSSGAAGKPTASAAIRGSLWYTPSGAGVVDAYEICRKSSGDTYAWVTLI